MRLSGSIATLRTVPTMLMIAAIVGVPEAAQAQLRQVTAVPRIAKTSPMFAYFISGLALVFVVVIAFRSAHRRKPEVPMRVRTPT